MPTNHLYDTWFQRIRELRPDQRITQLRNFALLVYGIYQSRSVYLSRIAGVSKSWVDEIFDMNLVTRELLFMELPAMGKSCQIMA